MINDSYLIELAKVARRQNNPRPNTCYESTRKYYDVYNKHCALWGNRKYRPKKDYNYEYDPWED